MRERSTCEIKLEQIQPIKHWEILSWAGHLARMLMRWAPRHLLTVWVAHPRPNGCPEMTRGRTLKKALKCKGLPVNFKEWRAIAEARSVRRSQTYSRPMPPSENCPCRVHESKDEHCITQMDTQPSQTCSKGYIFLLLYATVEFLCIFGEYFN